MADIGNISPQFDADGCQQPVQLVRLSFRYEEDSPVGQILHVTGDGQPRCYPLGPIAEANALDPSPIVDFASLAVLFC